MLPNRFTFRPSTPPFTNSAGIESRLDDMGRRLRSFPHYHMMGSDRFRLRVGDYLIIYKFDLARNEIYLLNVGHRREIYR